MTQPRPERIVRVRTEVAALSREFDYLVPASWTDPVVVGTRVRAPLHGRTVRGWVVADEVAPTPGLDVQPLKSWLGWGPPPSVVTLAGWAAWRWAGPESAFLRSASPNVIVRSLPPAPPPSPQATPTSLGGPGRFWADVPSGPGATVVRLPPATDLIDLVLAAANDARMRTPEGSVLVLVPSVGWADRLCARLVRRGLAATTDWVKARAGWPIVVGSRVGAWAPVPDLAGVVVLDAHDDAYREESAPTYSAVDVARERARRAGVRCVLTSPVPPVTLTGIPVVAAPDAEERAGWPAVERVDRRGADPRTGLFSEEFVRLARAVLDARADSDAPSGDDGPAPLVCVYNRKGGARLLACSKCGELARCLRCGAAALATPDKSTLHCPRCDEARPLVCSACGHLKMKTLRAGVSRLREELAALLGVDVEEVSGPATPRGASRTGATTAEPEPPSLAPAPALAPAPVLVGTEAVLHRVRRAAAVVFLDIDLHLLAPRLSAVDETLTLLVRAGRLVGARGAGLAWARVQVQTRVPDHPVFEAAVRGEPAPALAEEAEVRRAAGLPPFSALALISGPLAPAYADALAYEAAREGGAVAVTVAGEGTWLATAPDHRALCDLLARAERPPGRGLRVAVDPSSF
jgi:primosomal protein N' (replication factor Y) (superfamily II helicase)